MATPPKPKLPERMVRPPGMSAAVAGTSLSSGVLSMSHHLLLLSNKRSPARTTVVAHPADYFTPKTFPNRRSPARTTTTTVRVAKRPPK